MISAPALGPSRMPHDFCARPRPFAHAAYLSLVEPIWVYLGLVGFIWTYLSLVELIWAYLSLFGPFWAYWGLFERI